MEIDGKNERAYSILTRRLEVQHQQKSIELSNQTKSFKKISNDLAHKNNELKEISEHIRSNKQPAISLLHTQVKSKLISQKNSTDKLFDTVSKNHARTKQELGVIKNSQKEILARVQHHQLIKQSRQTAAEIEEVSEHRAVAVPLDQPTIKPPTSPQINPVLFQAPPATNNVRSRSATEQEVLVHTQSALVAKVLPDSLTVQLRASANEVTTVKASSGIDAGESGAVALRISSSTDQAYNQLKKQRRAVIKKIQDAGVSLHSVTLDRSEVNG